MFVNHRAPVAERGDDCYETPDVAIRALCKVERIPQRVWEPACGPGAIARVLRELGHHVRASDLVDYQSPDQDEARLDFLLVYDQPLANAIVTNPPYKLADQFVRKALDLVPYTAMLLRLNYLEGWGRRDITSALARVHVFRKRLPMMHRHGWTGERSNSSVPYAWFVWDATYTGPIVLDHL